MSVRLLLVLLAGCSGAVPSPSVPDIHHPEWAAYFQAREVEGCFVLLDDATGQGHVFNPARCDERFVPASTFKIFNTLVGLETGVVTDTTVFRWDGIPKRVPTWERDHDLRSAFRGSVVWYYEEIARRIPVETYRAMMQRENYGNADPGGATIFWLTGNLRISPREQVAFLRRLHHEQLPSFSTETIRLTKDIMVEETTADYTLRAKTGWAEPNGSDNLGWYVGTVERNGRAWHFALNIYAGPGHEGFGEARRAIALEILRAMAVLP